MYMVRTSSLSTLAYDSFQVPIPVKPSYALYKSIDWIIEASTGKHRTNTDNRVWDDMAREFIAAAKNDVGEVVTIERDFTFCVFREGRSGRSRSCIVCVKQTEHTRITVGENNAHFEDD